MDAVDPQRLQAAQRGDSAAQAELLRALQDGWYRLSFQQLRDAERAREATQETAMRFLKRLGEFRGESQLRTWAFGIAINVVREMKRPAKPLDARRLCDLRPEPYGPDLAASRREQASTLAGLVSALPDRQRQAVTLRFFEDLSVEATAQAMHCAPGTVKATIHQALRAIRKRLQPSRQREAST